MQHDEAPWQAAVIFEGDTPVPVTSVPVPDHLRSDADVPDGDGPDDNRDDAPDGVDVVDADLLPLTQLPRTRLRPLTRRAHVRVRGGTAAVLERLAWSDGEELEQQTVAVSIVPGSALPASFRRTIAGADLDDLLGGAESGCAPGRHRRPHPAWNLLRRVPGWRSTEPASWDENDDDDLAEDLDDDAPEAGLPTQDAPESDTEPYPTDAVLEANHADPLVPGPRDGEPADPAQPAEPAEGAQPAESDEPAEPAYRRRRRRSPAPATRSALQGAQMRIEAAPDRSGIARAVTEEAARLLEADVTALVLRAVDGPRVLWLHPGGPDADGLWGPATLAALLRVGHPVRRVVEGDPLAGGEATALLAVPVPAGGTLAGTLLARRHEARTFSATEQDVLSRLARMAGAALLTASRPSPRGRDDVDAVTGLVGPRRFAADVEAAVRTSDRRGIPVSVLAVHLAGLARLRDELGDRPADESLQSMTRALETVLRVGDLAYRIGQDELALLLPATDAAGLPSVQERLDAVVREVVAGLTFPGDPRPLTLRSAPVPLDGLAGAHVVDLATRALGLDPQKVRWARA